MSDLCRYDYVVQAIESLQEYIGTSSAESNTHQLVVDANIAVSELKRIEETLIGKQRIKKTTKKSIGRSIDEFNEISKQLKERYDEVNDFLEKNKKAFDQVKELSKNMKGMAVGIRSMESTRTSMMYIRRRVDARVKAIKRNIA